MNELTEKVYVVTGANSGIAFNAAQRFAEKGADTFIWLASSDDEAVLSAAGSYFFDRQKRRTAEFATDDAAARLWSVSDELIAPFL